jgi:predicted dehydrogenase
LDYVTWLFGFPLKSQSLLRSRSSLNIDSIDYANFQLEFDTFTANIILNYYRKDSKRNIEIIFEDDTWNIDLLKNIITSNKGSIIYENSDITNSNTYYNQMNYFLNQIKSNKKLMNSFQESLKVLKICLLHV